MADTPGPEIEMIVESVRVHMPTGRHVLLLKEVGLGRVLPIWIGPWEASAIAMRLQGMTPERPLTHDLLGTVIGELGARVERVVIVSLADETFHARLVLVTPDARHEVDARPSDAIALALRTESPIYAAASVLDHAASLPEPDEEDDESAAGSGTTDLRPGPARRPPRPGAPREATGEPIDTARLDVFRDFVNSLDLDGDQRGGGSSS
jgi:uncharacterized protein